MLLRPDTIDGMADGAAHSTGAERRPGPHAGGPTSQGGGAYPDAVDRVIAELSRLPGIGRRSAERLAFHLLKGDPDAAYTLASAITDLKRTVRHCTICSHLSGGDVCGICGDERRDRARVLVVEQPRDLIALEQTGQFGGVYHVLMGRLSPLDGIGPSELTIAELLTRIDHPERNAGGVRVEEVILGLNPTMEGDGTTLYLAEHLKGHGVRVTRLARGLPTGGQLEHASPAVLSDAILGRKELD